MCQPPFRPHSAACSSARTGLMGHQSGATGKPGNHPQAAPWAVPAPLSCRRLPAQLGARCCCSRKTFWVRRAGTAPCCGRGIIISKDCLSRLLSDFQRNAPLLKQNTQCLSGMFEGQCRTDFFCTVTVPLTPAPWARQRGLSPALAWCSGCCGSKSASATGRATRPSWELPCRVRLWAGTGRDVAERAGSLDSRSVTYQL